MSVDRTLTKAYMAELLFDRVGLNRREAREIIDTFFAEISNNLVAGNEIKLSGFGSFHIRDKLPRPGRNPKTGEVVTISARRVVTFHASQILRDAVELSGVK